MVFPFSGEKKESTEVVSKWVPMLDITDKGSKHLI